MKIMITGGHFSPAIAIIDKLQSIKNIKIVFVGRMYSSDNEKTLSLEYKEMIKRNIKFYNLETGRLTRLWSLKTLLNFFKTPFGFYDAYKIIKMERPNILLSFGGYLALPLAFIAYLFKITVYTHEQTIKPGLSNKIISFFAKKIFVSFKNTVNDFPSNKTIITGNPVRLSILKVIKKPFEISDKLPVIYITGGSMGSHSINLHIEKILPSLLKKYCVVHQTGNVKNYNDYDRLLKVKASLNIQLKKNYFLIEHLYEENLGYILSLAKLVISRAGANTFFELLLLKKPTIFIPLPWSAKQEQQKQALIFKQYKCGEIFNQNDKSDELLLLINKVMGNIQFYQSNFSKLEKLYKKNAVQRIIQEII